MVDHTVKSYDADLESLDRHIAEMGGIAEKMLADAMDALASMNAELAQKVIAADPRLDMLQRNVEEYAVRTIARRQPLAVDLREIIGAIRISADIERIGDLAKNIAKRATKIAGKSRIPRAVIGLKSMHDVAATQLNDVLDAYAQRDPERARAVWRHDVELDSLEDFGVPRSPHLHDGGSAQHHFLHASPVLFQEPRTGRRPHHQYRRDRRLYRHRRNPCRSSGRAGSTPRLCLKLRDSRIS